MTCSADGGAATESAICSGTPGWTMRTGTARACASGWSGAAAAIEPMRATSTGTARKEAHLTALQGSSRMYRKVGEAHLRPAHRSQRLGRFRRLERRCGGEVALPDEQDRHD